jgi:hypothetical protein
LPGSLSWLAWCWLSFVVVSNKKQLREPSLNEVLGAYTMEELCADCADDFRQFTGDILKTDLQIQPPDWLATLIQMPPADRDAAGPA